MQLPTELKHTHHKHGGRILRIEKIAHETAKPAAGRSRDIWFFVGDVEWLDRGDKKGGKSTGLEIAPYSLAYDDEKNQTEIDELLKLLNDYLLANGTWCGPESGHEGWYAHR